MGFPKNSMWIPKFNEYLMRYRWVSFVPFPFQVPFHLHYNLVSSTMALVPNGSSNSVQMSVQMSVRCTSKEIGLEDASHFK